jgi:hypothetical protein
VLLDRAGVAVSQETEVEMKTEAAAANWISIRSMASSREPLGRETKAQLAVNAIMGHAPAANDMASIYRERISDERLRAVTDIVRTWLFGSTRPAAKRMKPDGPSTRKPATARSRR